MNYENNSEEVTISVGDERIIISHAGVWIDLLNEDGTVQSSSAKAWEELEVDEFEMYLEIYMSNTHQLVTANSVPWIDADLPALKATG